jgi:hypothetical protein
MTATTEATEPKYTADQLGEYQNKRVKVIRNLSEPDENGNGAVEIEGTVQAGNELGLLIKPKGQVSFKLIDRAEIEDISLVADKSSELKRSKLKPVKVGQARRHLLERHGYKLTDVNGMTEEQAMEFHDSLDHEALDLGHVHVAESEKSDVADEASDSDADDSDES